jgi:hypothetical protein
VRLAGAGEAAECAAFLARLLRWDRAAVVRVRAAGEALAVFGQPPFGPVLAVRPVALAAPAELDATVSAGQLLDGIEESTALLTLPPTVTGPAWTGLLPPRGGWRRLPGPDGPDGAELVRGAARAAVTEFRDRTEALVPEQRTRAALDGIAEDIWSRVLGDTGLPLRAVHAAHALGFLRPVRVPAGPPSPEIPGEADAPAARAAYASDEVRVLAAGPWLRLATPHGSVAVRRSAPGLSVTPTRPSR